MYSKFQFDSNWRICGGGDGLPTAITVEAKLPNQRYSGNRNTQLVSSHCLCLPRITLKQA